MSNKVLIREFFALCPNGICKDNLSEQDKINVKENDAVYLTGVIQAAETVNGNNRVYPKETLEREMEKYLQLVQEARALGELDHRDEAVVNLKNVSHLVEKVWWEGNNVMGKLRILNTPSGHIIKTLINDGVKLGISSRGVGSLREENGKMLVEDDYQLICFDIVQEPSTTNAFLVKEYKEIQTTKTSDKLSRIFGLMEKIVK